MRRTVVCAALFLAPVGFANSTAQPPAPPPAAKAKKRVTLTIDAGGHTDAIGRVAFTPDGRYLVSGSADQSIRVWEVPGGRPVRVIRPPGNGSCSVMALAPDGRTVAVAHNYHHPDDTWEHVVYVLALADGAVERVLRGHTKQVLAVAYSADGKRLATSSHDGTLRVWVAATGAEEVAHKVNIDTPGAKSAWHTGPGELAFNPTATRVAYVTQDGDCRLLNLKTGKAAARLPAPEGSRHLGVAWSPDGKTIATWCTNKVSECRLWAADEKGGFKPGDPIPGLAGVSAARFSPDSAKLVVAWNANGRHRGALVSVATGKRAVEYAPAETQKGFGEPLEARDAAVSADGRWVATAGGDRGTHEIYLWRANSTVPVREMAARAWFHSGQNVAWAPDGKAVAWSTADAEKGQLRAFDFAALRMTDVPRKGALWPAHKAAGGLTLERQDPANRYYETQVVKDGRVQSRVAVPHASHVPAARTFVGPERVAVAGDWGGFFLHDAATGKLVREFHGPTGSIETIAASPPAPPGVRYLATAGADQTLRVWHPERDYPLVNVYANGPDWIAWVSGGYYAASPNGDRLVGWKVDNGIDAAPSYYPAEQLKARLHRPDVIRRLLEAGGTAEAFKLANAELAKAGAPVPRAPAGGVESVLPPGVSIRVDATKLPVVKVTATARPGAADQKVKSLRVMVDGRRLPDGAGTLEFPAGQEPATVDGKTWEFTLPPGRHTVSALARSTDDTPGFSDPVEVLAPPGAAARPAVHVLAVGVSQYQKVRPNLSFAHTDAARVKAAFTACATGGLAYRLGEAAVVQNGDATRKGVLDALATARQAAKAGDLFVFFFAGHGTRDGGEFFLLTHDADPATGETMRKTAVPGSELRARLADFPCQVLVVLDACHAGEVGALPPGADEAARGLADPDVRVAVMCAALGHETAKEAKGAGVFTATLARALESGPKAGVFFDRVTGELNVYHLQAFVYQEVVRAPGGAQTPYLRMPLGHPAFTITQFPPPKP